MIVDPMATTTAAAAAAAASPATTTKTKPFPLHMVHQTGNVVDDSGIESEESGRSRRQSPLALELQNLGVILPPQITNSDEPSGRMSASSSSLDIFSSDKAKSEDDFMDFMPNVGWFGAPMCRWTSSVMALVGMMSGLVFTASGACILIFFVDEEPTIFPLGVTLGVVGILLSFIGAIMWISEFMCDDCLGRAHKKIQEAPIKNALKRRSRMASRASGATSTAKMIVESRTQSKMSNASVVNYRPNGVSNRNVSMRY